MRAWLLRHLAAELEVHTLEEVAITSREDAIGLKLLNLRNAALALNTAGLVREVRGCAYALLTTYFCNAAPRHRCA